MTAGSSALTAVRAADVADMTGARVLDLAPARRGGFSLVELVVALTLLAVALVALAGTAATAGRAFADAASTEMAARAAAAVIDSLMHEPDPRPGARPFGAINVEWAVRVDGAVQHFDVNVSTPRDSVRIAFHAARPYTPPELR
jgi:prepilin-type N-terminal cleavage/methylation domain-containing protein